MDIEPVLKQIDVLHVDILKLSAKPKRKWPGIWGGGGAF